MYKPRVLYLIHDFPPLSGGMARYYHNLLLHLPQDEVVALVSHSADSDIYRFPIINANIPMKRNYSTLQLYPRWFSILNKTTKRYSPCLSMACSMGFAKMLLNFSLIKTRLRYGIFIHGFDVVREVNKARESPLKWFRLNYIIDKSVLIVANSEYTAGLIRGMMNHGNLVVVYPGVDTKTFRPLEIPKVFLRRSLGVPEDMFILLYVGRPVKRKGLGLLLKTLPHLPNDVFLIVIGPGDFVQFIDIAKKYGVSSRVLFKGYQDDETLVKFYNAADVFVMPVLKNQDDVEGFGIVYIEASSTGLPVIGSSIGGVKESVKDGVTGFLLKNTTVEELTSKIRTLIESPQLRISMGTAGRRWVINNFRWDLSALKLRNTYLSVCS